MATYCEACGIVQEDDCTTDVCERSPDGHEYVSDECCLCGRELNPPSHLPLCRWCSGTAREAARSTKASLDAYEPGEPKRRALGGW